MNMKAKLIRFNQIYKEMDVLYHNYAKQLGLSDTAFWVLYCICERDATFTQRELCREWSFSPQTLNSALKDMEKRGLICLDPVPGNKKNKLLSLTADGKQLVATSILPLMQAEADSFCALNEAECEQMLSLTERYAAALRQGIETLTK